MTGGKKVSVKIAATVLGSKVSVMKKGVWLNFDALASSSISVKATQAD